MTNIAQTLSTLHNRFTYKRDKGRDRWRILSKTGNVAGDCEDFALTLLRDHFGIIGMWWALLRGHCELVYCTINPSNDGHAVAVIDDLIYDCNRKKPFGWHSGYARLNIYKRAYRYSVTSIIVKLVGRYWFLTACGLSAGVLGAITQVTFSIFN